MHPLRVLADPRVPRGSAQRRPWREGCARRAGRGGGAALSIYSCRVRPGRDPWRDRHGRRVGDSSRALRPQPIAATAVARGGERALPPRVQGCTRRRKADAQLEQLEPTAAGGVAPPRCAAREGAVAPEQQRRRAALLREASHERAPPPAAHDPQALGGPPPDREHLGGGGGAPAAAHAAPAAPVQEGGEERGARPRAHEQPQLRRTCDGRRPAGEAARLVGVRVRVGVRGRVGVRVTWRSAPANA
jgi:hypothetical protein